MQVGPQGKLLIANLNLEHAALSPEIFASYLPHFIKQPCIESMCTHSCALIVVMVGCQPEPACARALCCIKLTKLKELSFLSSSRHLPAHLHAAGVMWPGSPKVELPSLTSNLCVAQGAQSSRASEDPKSLHPKAN